MSDSGERRAANFLMLCIILFIVLVLDALLPRYADTAYVEPSGGGYVVILRVTGIRDVTLTNPLPLKDAEGIANDYNVILWDRQLRPSAVRTDKVR